MEVYLNDAGPAPPSERQGVSVIGPITAAKETVQVTDLAERLSGPGVRRGRELAFRCPLHDDHNPSMRVDPDKGLWFCDPCGVGGDVVELARLAWRYPNDGRGAADSAADLLHSFGHPLPERPPSWFAKQERQRGVRAELDRLRVHILRRRLYRIVEPMILAVEDDDLREDVAREVWTALRPWAEDMLLEVRKENSS